MNDKDKATHIGEIMLALDDETKTVLRKGDDGLNRLVTEDDLQSLLSDLVVTPERFSIEKEPRVIFVNAYQHPEGRVFVKDFPDKAKAEAMDSWYDGYDTSTAIRTAVPIELPLTTLIDINPIKP